MVGVPARRIGWMCQCGIRLELREGAGACPACGATYRESEGRLRQIDPPAKGV
jgi:UDP-2-acetamido-3-amino-2,3-dideoxy-glucuronate N-acetyltransferase